MSSLKCKVCGHAAHYIGQKDLGTPCISSAPFIPTGEMVRFYTCKSCGLTFTPFFDTWTSSDFSERIYNSEYVIYDPEYTGKRAESNYTAISTILSIIGFSPETKLDYGAGSGVFAKKIAGKAYDPYSSPSRPLGTFELITCFEVAEHHTNPLELFKDIKSFLSSNGLVIMSTMTLNRPSIDHWYIGPRNGHCTFYNKNTLSILASQCNLEYKSLDDSTHIFREKLK